MSADLYGPSSSSRSSSIFLSTRRTPLGDHYHHSITTPSTGVKPRFILEYFSFSSVFVFASRPCPRTIQPLWPSPSLATPSVFPIYYLLFVTPPPFHYPRISSRSPLPLLLTPFPLLQRFDHRHRVFSICINDLFLPEWICASPTPSPSIPARIRLDR
ncbi:hypothetical protein EDB85DRAFT_1920514 [Lactarius pseudohatsudake]|nr:hypothetical protein EDB85DRAFT_1920514 [Lactarius pseudohatsudake]